ncbi:MAG: hypothetical protein QXQ57_07025, partial [Sulfolobales archaeon]
GYIDVKEIPLRSVRPWIYIDAKDHREALQKIYEAEARARSMHKPPILVLKIRTRLERNERDRLVGVLEQLVRDRRILAYDGPEIEDQPQPMEGSRDPQVGSIGVEDAVNRIFRDPEVRSFIIDVFIRGRLSCDALLQRLLESKGIVEKLLEEPEVRRLLQNNRFR